MSKERQLRKQEEIRTAILNTAREIIGEEGIQGLSIRKITAAIDYSPAIVYHYFTDKNEILETLLNEEYGKILASVREVPANEEQPEMEMKEVFIRYIKNVLRAPDIYRAVMLNSDPTVLKRTSLLERGISQRSPTLQMLCRNIQRGIERGRYAACDPELTAQVIWAASFGLTIKLMMERDIPEEQMDRLIEHQFEILFHGLLSKETETK